MADSLGSTATEPLTLELLPNKNVNAPPVELVGGPVVVSREGRFDLTNHRIRAASGLHRIDATILEDSAGR